MQALIVRSHWHLVVFYVVLFVCFAPEWLGSLFQRPEQGAIKRDRGSHLLLVIAVIAGTVAAFYFVDAGYPGTTLTWHQPLLFWIGISLMLAGLDSVGTRSACSGGFSPATSRRGRARRWSKAVHTG